jgi:transposase
MRTIGSPAELERRRLRAVQRVRDGFAAEEVADFLDVDPRSVRRWAAAFRLHGTAGLAARPATGRPRKLTATQEKLVCRWLADSSTDHGFATELWSAPRLRLRIEQEFGTRFHPDYLTCWLRQRGSTPQLPRRTPRERNEGLIDRWLAVDWPRIKRAARRRGACLVLMAESGLLLAPLRRRSWAPRGRPPEIRQKANHREQGSVAAALWLRPGRDRLALAYQTLANGYSTNVDVADFLRGAVQWLDAPLVVIWDGGSMPKGDPINELIRESQGRLTLESLPAHAAELMPMEQVWTWLKYGRRFNFPPRDARHLNEAIIRELDPVRDDQRRLRNFFHASRLPLPRTLLS